MPEIQTTITPHTQKPLVSRSYPSEDELGVMIQNASKAQQAWCKVSLEDRVNIAQDFMVLRQTCDFLL